MQNCYCYGSSYCRYLSWSCFYLCVVIVITLLIVVYFILSLLFVFYVAGTFSVYSGYKDYLLLDPYSDVM